jgi:predicted nucleotidyltransferase
MDKGEVIEKVRAYKTLLKKYFQFEKMYLFGSFANGTFNEHSDIDVAVVVNHVEGDFFSVNPLLWKLRRQIDDRIEPLLIEKDFDDAGFLAEVQKNGIEIV